MGGTIARSMAYRPRVRVNVSVKDRKFVRGGHKKKGGSETDWVAV